MSSSGPISFGAPLSAGARAFAGMSNSGASLPPSVQALRGGASASRHWLWITLLVVVVVGIVGWTVYYYMDDGKKKNGARLGPGGTQQMYGPGGMQRQRLGPGGQRHDIVNAPVRTKSPVRMQERPEAQAPSLQARYDEHKQQLARQTMMRRQGVKGVVPASNDPRIFNLTKDLDPLGAKDIPLEKIFPTMKGRKPATTAKESIANRFVLENIKAALKDRGRSVMETDRTYKAARYGVRADMRKWQQMVKHYEKMFRENPHLVEEYTNNPRIAVDEFQFAVIQDALGASRHYED